MEKHYNLLDDSKDFDTYWEGHRSSCICPVGWTGKRTREAGLEERQAENFQDFRTV